MDTNPQHSLTDLYEEAIYQNNPRYSLISDFWGALPRRLSEIPLIIKKSSFEVGDFDDTVFSSLKSLIKKTHSHFGVETHKVKEIL